MTIEEIAERNYRINYIRPNGKPNLRAREEYEGLDGEALHDVVVNAEIKRLTTLFNREKKNNCF